MSHLSDKMGFHQFVINSCGLCIHFCLRKSYLSFCMKVVIVSQWTTQCLKSDITTIYLITLPFYFHCTSNIMNPSLQENICISYKKSLACHETFSVQHHNETVNLSSHIDSFDSSTLCASDQPKKLPYRLVY